MTMHNLPHPDDERLAAYAGGDADATADESLVAHLNACDRCRPIVDELSLLRIALAELPDLAPSRPLRLIPPVPARTAMGAGSWLRRLTAPAMAAGAGLVLVGAVGLGATSAIGGFFRGPVTQVFQNVGENLQGAGAPGSEATASDDAYVPGVKGSPAPSSEQTRGPGASPVDSDGTEGTRESSNEQPWLTLLVAGAGLFVIATALRFTISPRAG